MIMVNGTRCPTIQSQKTSKLEIKSNRSGAVAAERFVSSKSLTRVTRGDSIRGV